MVFEKVAVFAILATAIHATPIGEHGHYVSHAPVVSYAHAPVVSYAHAPVAAVHAPVQVEHYAPPHYEFKYGVRDEHTHDIKEQAEKREGDRVEGYYSLLEPDGTTRTVHYTADHHNGFNAHVERSGHAAHPAAPVQKVVAAPVVHYAHAAPVVSHGYSLGSYH